MFLATCLLDECAWKNEMKVTFVVLVLNILVSIVIDS